MSLTHWGRVTLICVSKLTIISSENGLSPGRRQAIISTNAGILLSGTSETTFSRILTEIQIFSFKRMHSKYRRENVLRQKGIFTFRVYHTFVFIWKYLLWIVYFLVTEVIILTKNNNFAIIVTKYLKKLLFLILWTLYRICHSLAIETLVFAA